MEKSIGENKLGQERIGKLLRMYAIPSIISMLVNSLYNIVDQIFIGQGVGYLGNGARRCQWDYPIHCNIDSICRRGIYILPTAVKSIWMYT